MSTIEPTPTQHFPELSLRISAVDDPVLAQLGFDPRSDYVERYWLSILGPSAVLFLRRVASRFEAEPDGFELDLVEWAQELGLGAKGGNTARCGERSTGSAGSASPAATGQTSPSGDTFHR